MFPPTSKNLQSPDSLVQTSLGVLEEYRENPAALYSGHGPIPTPKEQSLIRRTLLGHL